MSVSSIISSLSIKHYISECLKEDQNNFDYSAYLFGEHEGTAEIIMNDKGVVAGLSFINAIFKEMGCIIKWQVNEGQQINMIPTTLACVTGPRKEIYKARYIALNILSRACGIATLAKRMIDKVKSLNWNGSLTGTTKFTPGFGLVEKYAMLVGGIDSGRYDPSSLMILDNNHTQFCGSIAEAIASARRASSHAKVAVLCKNPKEVENAVCHEPDVLLLDSFEPYLIPSTCKQIKSKYPKIIIEVCGSVVENNLSALALPQIDVISCSRLCQDYTALNIELKFALKPAMDEAVQNGSPILNATSDSTVEKSIKPDVSSNLKRPASSSGATTSSTTLKTEPSDSTPEKKSKIEAVTPKTDSATKVSSDSSASVKPTAASTTPTQSDQSSNKAPVSKTPQPASKPASASVPLKPQAVGSNQGKNSPKLNSGPNRPTAVSQNKCLSNSNSMNQRRYFNQPQQQKPYNNRGGNQEMHRFPISHTGPAPRGPVQTEAAVGLVRMVAANLGINISQSMGNNPARPGAPFRPPPFATNSSPGSILGGSASARAPIPQPQRPPLIPGGGVPDGMNRMPGHHRGHPRLQGPGGRPGGPRW